MNTQHQHNECSTNVPPAEHCDQRVAEARRLFQRTLAKWASDVLMIRHQRLTEPAWANPARGSLALIHPDDACDGWNQAA